MYMIFSYFVFGYKNKPSMSLHPNPNPTCYKRHQICRESAPNPQNHPETFML